MLNKFLVPDFLRCPKFCYREKAFKCPVLSHTEDSVIMTFSIRSFNTILSVTGELPSGRILELFVFCWFLFSEKINIPLCAVRDPKELLLTPDQLTSIYILSTKLPKNWSTV